MNFVSLQRNSWGLQLATLTTGKTEAVSGDDPTLGAAIASILGKKCWLVAFGYAGELHLNFGARIPSFGHRKAGKTVGAWRFNTCGTAWTLHTPIGELSSSKRNKKLLEQALKLSFEGSKIVRFEFGRTTELTFSNSCTLSVNAKISDDRYPEVPY